MVQLPNPYPPPPPPGVCTLRKLRTLRIGSGGTAHIHTASTHIPKYEAFSHSHLFLRAGGAGCACHRCLKLLLWLNFTLFTTVIKACTALWLILSPHSNKIITSKLAPFKITLPTKQERLYCIIILWNDSALLCHFQRDWYKMTTLKLYNS